MRSRGLRNPRRKTEPSCYICAIYSACDRVCTGFLNSYSSFPSCPFRRPHIHRKTSSVKYLAKRFIHINNHEHTDIRGLTCTSRIPPPASTGPAKWGLTSNLAPEALHRLFIRRQLRNAGGRGSASSSPRRTRRVVRRSASQSA
ncbi:hypothetical protein B0H12DRAFT_1123503 [Mycena haematopus]|nr:hypothetical protein B0H12DRAFT_1123503 [Mycena haematopus]